MLKKRPSIFRSMVVIVIAMTSIWGVKAQESESAYKTSWMALLSDSVSVSRLNIPGSRQSTFLKQADEDAGTAYYVQTGTIAQQLAEGVRALDLWIEADEEDGLRMNYGKGGVEHNFSDHVLAPVIAFLEANPTETVALFVRTLNNDDDRASELLTHLLLPYAHTYYMDNPSVGMKLGDARGKFFVVRTGSGVQSKYYKKDLSVVVDWKRTVDTVRTEIGDAGSTERFVVSDRSSNTGNGWLAKKNSLTKAFKDANAEEGNGWHLSFAGYEAKDGFPSHYVTLISPHVAGVVLSNLNALYGFIMLDCIMGATEDEYASRKAIEVIISSNDKYKPNIWTGLLSSDWNEAENWSKKEPLSREEEPLKLYIDNSALNPIRIEGALTVAHIENTGGIGIEVAPGAILTVAGPVLGSDETSGILLAGARDDEPAGVLYVENKDQAEDLVVTFERNGLGVEAGQWQYYAPLTKEATPTEIYGERSVLQWDRNAWVAADSTQVVPPFRGFTVANSTSPSICMERGHVFVSDTLLEVAETEVPQQYFFGNSFAHNLPIQRLDFNGEAEPCVYLPLPSASAGRLQAVPKHFAGVHGLPSRVASGETFFSFIKNGGILMPYLQPADAVEEASSEVLPAVVAELLSDDGSVLDRVWIFVGNEYKDEFVAGYDAYKTLSAHASELMLESADGSLQVATKTSIDGLRFVLRPVGEENTYSIRFVAYDGVESSLKDYYLIDETAKDSKPLQFGKAYPIILDEAGARQSFLISEDENPMSQQGVETAELSCLPLSNGSLLINKPQLSATLFIYNAQGALVSREDLSEGETRFERAYDLVQGYYIAHLMLADGRAISVRFAR